MSALLSLYFPGADTSYELDPRIETVGGISETCELDLKRYFFHTSLKTISRRHFKIVYIQDEGFAIYDLNSLNGTRVNELRLIPGQPVFLRENDEIMLAENQEFNFQAVGFDSERTELWMLIPNETSAVAKPTRGLLYQSEDGSFVLDGARIPHTYLTSLEQRLLEYLYTHSGRICSFDELIQNVWGPKSEDVQDNTVAKLVSNLRKKLDAVSAGAGARHIRTVHGRGFECVPV